MDSIELAVLCQTDVADHLATELEKAAGSEVDQVDENNLDGTAVVLQVVQVAVSLISAVAPIVVAYINSKKVKKVKLGSIEIENPTREQWEQLWKQYISNTPAGRAQ